MGGDRRMIAAAGNARYELAASLCRGAHVLHLCCGAGDGSRILAAAAASVHAVDGSADAIARAEAANGDGGIAFEVADPVDHLRSFGEDGACDVIVCLDAERAQDPEALSAELARRARDGVPVVTAPQAGDGVESAVVLAGGTPADVHVRRLEVANRELQRINTQLARERLGIHDAAAAALLRRLEDQTALAAQWKRIADGNDWARRELEERLESRPHQAAEAVRELGSRLRGGGTLRRLRRPGRSD
jgi:SAM-dependent methyltransferase